MFQYFSIIILCTIPFCTFPFPQLIAHLDTRYLFIYSIMLVYMHYMVEVVELRFLARGGVMWPRSPRFHCPFGVGVPRTLVMDGAALPFFW